LSPIDGFIAINEVIAVDEDFNQDKLTVYPNPVLRGEMLNVKLQGAHEEGFNLSVYDITGKVLIRQHYNPQDKFTVDVSAFPSGTYILVIRNGDVNLTKKFIVN